MSKKNTSTKPAEKQGLPPHPLGKFTVTILPKPDPAIAARARAKAAGCVFNTACAMEALGNLLQNAGDLEEVVVAGAGSLQTLLGEGLMEAYDDLRFLEDDHKPAAAGGQR